MRAVFERDPERQRFSPNHFIRAAFAVAQAKAAKRPVHALIAADDEVSPAIIEQRTAAAPGTTTTSGFASQVAQTAFRGFLASLAPYSGAARLIAKALPAELGANVSAKYPTRPAGPAAPQWVKELDPIPVSNSVLDEVEIGPKRKIASIVPWTRELSKRSDAAAIFATMLREDAALGLDSALFSADAGTDAVHEGLLYNLAPLAPANFTGAEGAKGVLSDLAAAVASNGGSGDVLFSAAPELVARLRVTAPDLAAAADIAPSGAIPAGRIVAVDPMSVLVSIDDFPDIDAAEHATVHMSDNPLPLVSGSPADPVRSGWQTATIMLRIIAEMAWAKRRSGAVAYADSVQWW